MKKLLSIALVAGMFSFYACDQKPAEESTEVEVTTEEAAPTAEEAPAVEAEVEVEADTTMTPTETPAQ